MGARKSKFYKKLIEQHSNFENDIKPPLLRKYVLMRVDSVVAAKINENKKTLKIVCLYNHY